MNPPTTTPVTNNIQSWEDMKMIVQLHYATDANLKNKQEQS